MPKGQDLPQKILVNYLLDHLSACQCSAFTCVCKGFILMLHKISPYFFLSVYIFFMLSLGDLQSTLKNMLVVQIYIHLWTRVTKCQATETEFRYFSKPENVHKATFMLFAV